MKLIKTCETCIRGEQGKCAHIPCKEWEPLPLTVKDVIEKLKQFDGDLPVYMQGRKESDGVIALCQEGITIEDETHYSIVLITDTKYVEKYLPEVTDDNTAD